MSVSADKKAAFRALRDAQEKKYNDHFDNCRVFWAFSNEQFEENKTELPEGDKYASIGGGGFIPSTLVDQLIAGNTAIFTEMDEAIKAQGLEEAEIAYQLWNHEAFYVGSIEETMRALDNKYSREKVIEVYRMEKSLYDEDN